MLAKKHPDGVSSKQLHSMRMFLHQCGFELAVKILLLCTVGVEAHKINLLCEEVREYDLRDDEVRDCTTYLPNCKPTSTIIATKL